MKVLERYILRRVLIQTVGATAATLGIVWTVQALTKVNLVTNTGQSIGSFLLLATLLLPAIISIVMPVSVLIATTQTLNMMNTDSELAVIHGAGAPKFLVYKPILIVATLASLMIILVTNFAEPYTRQAARQLVADARADLLSIVIQEGSFKEIDKNVYMQIAKRLPGGLLGGLFIADERDKKTDLIYYAREGAVVKQDGINLLLMKDGEIHQKSINTGQVSIIRFSSYAFDLSEFTASTSKPFLYPKDQTTTYLMNPDANDETLKRQPLLLSVELHRRFSVWLYPLVFAMIGVGACGYARSHRVTSVGAILNAMAVSIIIRWLGLVAENTSETIAYLWPTIYIVPLTGIFVPLWLAYKNIPIALSASTSDRIEKFIASLAKVRDKLLVKISGFRRSKNMAGA